MCAHGQDYLTKHVICLHFLLVYIEYVQICFLCWGWDFLLFFVVLFCFVFCFVVVVFVLFCFVVGESARPYQCLSVCLRG